MSVLETTYNPETITSVTQSPATVGATVSPTITVTNVIGAGFKCICTIFNQCMALLLQHCAICFVGATGTATIPAQACRATV